MAWSDAAREAAAEARKKSAAAKIATKKAELTGKAEDHQKAAEAHHEAERANKHAETFRQDTDSGETLAKRADDHGWKAAEHENKAEDLGKKQFVKAQEREKVGGKMAHTADPKVQSAIDADMKATIASKMAAKATVRAQKSNKPEDHNKAADAHQKAEHAHNIAAHANNEEADGPHYARASHHGEMKRDHDSKMARAEAQNYRRKPV